MHLGPLVHLQVNDESFFFRENERTRHRENIARPASIYIYSECIRCYFYKRLYTHRYKTTSRKSLIDIILES